MTPSRSTRMFLRRTAILTASFALVCACSMNSGSTPSGGNNGDDTEGSDHVRIGSTLTLPPFAFVDTSGTPTGFELEVVEEILNRLGATTEYVKVDFSQAITGLQADKFDLVASNVHITCERVENTEEVGEFAVPFYQTSEVLVTTVDNADTFTSFEALSGANLGVEGAGSVADKMATEAADEHGFETTVFADNQQLMQALEQGRIDAALQSHGVAAYSTTTNTDLAVSAVISDTDSYNGLLFRAGDPLLPDVNDAINEMKEDGTLADIYEEWFGAPPADGNAAITIMEPVDDANCSG